MRIRKENFSNSAEIKLPERAAQLHATLVANQGKTVPLDEIRKRLHLYKSASPNGVAVEVSRLRKLLGNNGPKITARPKVGYKMENK